MSVRIEKPFEAPGHKIRFGQTEEDYKRVPRHWVSCSCGWVTTPEEVNIHHYGLARQHLAPFVEHDLEYDESGVFVRATCSCGGWTGSWHHQAQRRVDKALRGEHANHCAAVKYQAAMS